MKLAHRHACEGTVPRITIGQRMYRRANGSRYVSHTWTAQWSCEGRHHYEALKTRRKDAAIRQAFAICERLRAGEGKPKKYTLAIEELREQYLDLTRTIRLVLERLPTVPVVHFGDLDPNGVRIFRHLRDLRPEARWLVPAFWAEFIPTKGLKATWPSELDLNGTPDLVRELAHNGVWLEQEAIALDPRLADALTL